MRIATWNCCRGGFENKVPLLQKLTPDVAVVQECARPEEEVPRCIWVGENPKQGLAVLASDGWTLNPFPTRPDVPKYMFPVRVTGPREFLLLAVWSKREGPYPYVEGVCRGVELYRDLIVAQPTVITGDLNSNAIWDGQHPSERNHSALVSELAELGLVSGYHAFHHEAHGAETRPTFYFHKKKHKPFHIDYCFLPGRWIPELRDVAVGEFDEWAPFSDHRPLVVTLS